MEGEEGCAGDRLVARAGGDEGGKKRGGGGDGGGGGRGEKEAHTRLVAQLVARTDRPGGVRGGAGGEVGFWPEGLEEGEVAVYVSARGERGLACVRVLVIAYLLFYIVSSMSSGLYRGDGRDMG